MKKYLYVSVYRNDGTMFHNHLKLSEAHFISRLAQENRYLTVSIETVTNKRYKTIFG